MPLPDHPSCRARLPFTWLAVLLALVTPTVAPPASAENGIGYAAPSDERTRSDAVDSSGARSRPRWIAPQRLEPRPLDPALPSRRSTALLGAVADDSPPLAAARGNAAKAWTSDARVVVHAVRENAELAETVIRLLRSLGADDVERRVVERTPSSDEVRYFQGVDAAMAADVAAELEDVFDAVRVRDFTHYRPSPSSGLLELWLR